MTQPAEKRAEAERDIAEVKALRERVAEFEAKKWEVQHTDTMNEIVQLGLARDEAEAHATELAGALETMRDNFCRSRCDGSNPNGPHWGKCVAATTALAILPAQALERARARDEVIKALREPWEYDGPVGVLEALTKLDALTPEDGT
jgi:hypothetical protein